MELHAKQLLLWLILSSLLLLTCVYLCKSRLNKGCRRKIPWSVIYFRHEGISYEIVDNSNLRTLLDNNSTRTETRIFHNHSRPPGQTSRGRSRLFLLSVSYQTTFPHNGNQFNIRKRWFMVIIFARYTNFQFSRNSPEILHGILERFSSTKFQARGVIFQKLVSPVLRHLLFPTFVAIKYEEK